MNSNIEINVKDLLERQKALCQEYNVDYGKVKEVNSKIALLLQKVVEIEALNKLIEVHINIRRNTGYWIEIWKVFSSPSVHLTPKQKSLLELFLYLTLSEGMFSEIVQAITFILMKNDHDIYDPQRMKFVKGYEELDRVSLFVKLQFMEKHGLEFITHAMDRKLRNKIAHLGFIVNDDGSILDRRTHKITRGLKKKSDYLGCVCAVTLDAIGISLTRKISQIQ